MPLDPRFVNELCKKHGKVIEELLEHRKDVLEESKKDLAQLVLLIFRRRVEEEGCVEDDMRPFLGEVIRKQVANHKNRWKPPVKQGADAEAVAVLDEEMMDPEGAAELAELQRKLERNITLLPEALATVIRCVDIWEMSIEATARALRRPPSTISSQLASAREKLHEIARASERAMALRGPRPPRPAR
jgi:DNA-directed RNA polymerase specialized sigma24 family protein